MAPKPGVPRLWKLASRSGVENGTIVLYLEGRLGQATTAELRVAVEAAGARAGGLVIDLAGVDYLSSAAIKVFESLQAEQGLELTFRAPSPAARVSLELAGLSNRTN
jgi:anti-anti-sigma factor